MKRTVKRFLEGLGVVALVQGALGLVHGTTGRLRGWGLVQRLGVLDGYESYTSVALLVLSCALFAAAGSRESG
ncbi:MULTISPECIES: hypothetical protein [unclassified Streptomyces]|uniref:hypothetical protein n=1 Tax=unclassified Streptomyces TaxID=2593676 RepID=UPI00381BBB8F|nr:hypothetical protein OG199_11130 [Streptomyces sp. NBC_01176]